VIRAKQCSKNALKQAPKSFKFAPIKNSDNCFVLQTYPEDCTGCGLCIEACPAKNKQNPEKRAVNFGLIEETIEKDRENITFFEALENLNCPREPMTVKDMQFVKPLFEFPGACAGCGETPYVKLLTQLFGDRMLIADACGCTLVYGGNMPTTPWCRNEKGQGVAWAGSLFEDNAEFGYGYLLTEDKHREMAYELVDTLSDQVGIELAKDILNAEQKTNAAIDQQRERVIELKKYLETIEDPRAKHLLSLADHLVRHSIWALGGDGWAYDIGFGGLDHVLASGRNINIFIVDTEVYSNTGGQASKASPRGAVVKFAMKGKSTAKKDIGLMMMSYRNVYVARIALDANPAHAIKAIKEAESYDGPSLIIAYSQCIAHGFDLRRGIDQQTLAVQSGYWPLYRYNPALEREGKNPFQLDSKAPSIPAAEYMQNENRFKLLFRSNPEHAKEIMRLAQDDVDKRWKIYERMAKDE
jgi:pyruvate-ferredoxin/flavodoxin oxidoreductase